VLQRQQHSSPSKPHRHMCSTHRSNTFRPLSCLFQDMCINIIPTKSHSSHNNRPVHKSFTMKYSSSILIVYLLVLRSADSFSTSYRKHTPSSRKSSPLFRNQFTPEANQRQNTVPSTSSSSSRTSTSRTSLSVATVPVAAITGALTGGLLGGALHAIAGEMFSKFSGFDDPKIRYTVRPPRRAPGSFHIHIVDNCMPHFDKRCACLQIG
jgi:hypothetical protein